MRLLDRYLSREIVLPFLVGLTGFVLIEIGTLLFNRLIEVMLEFRVPVQPILEILMLKMPLFIVLALPIATLFGVSLGINRLARDGEINAMRMAGVPLRRMLVPMLFVSLLIAAGDYLIEEKVAPPANAKASEVFQKIWMQSNIPAITADTFFHVGNRWFYIGTVEKSSDNRFLLHKLMIYELRAQDYPILMVAEKAATDGTDWYFTKPRYFDMLKGQEVFGSDTGSGRPGYLRLPVNLEQFTTMQRGPDDMSSAELSQQIRRFSAGGVKADSLVMAYHLKYSIPAGCIIVALVSFPLAVRYSRYGSFMGVLLSIVLFFFYYNTYFLSRLLGAQGTLPPVIAAWSHNVIFAALGLVLLWREE